MAEEKKISPFQARMDAAIQVEVERATGDANWKPTITSRAKPDLEPTSDHTETTTKIKTEAVESAISLLELPQEETSERAALRKNPYAELTASRKRKCHDDLFLPQDEDDEEEFSQPAPSRKIKRFSQSIGATLGSNPAGFSSHQLTMPTLAPAKKLPVNKANPQTIQLVATRTTKNVGTWYDTINMHQAFKRSDLGTLKYLLILIQNCETGKRIGENLEPHFARIRKRLHDMETYDFVSGVLLRKSKVLEDKGLDSILEDQAVNYPWDIRADAMVLYRKWRRGVLDPHLLRGIDTKKGTNSKGNKFTSRNLEMGYIGRTSCNYTGEGNLVNGQWWPLQICALRDGAHGELEGGIHGQPGKWAYSIVLGGGGYSDIDQGDTIKYCGTSGAGGEASAGTRLLKKSFEETKNIRVLRSSTLAKENTYRPSKGLRYDGVYKIISYEILDQNTAMHRFTLRRRSHQDPIRCSGVEARPTEEELSEYSKIRGLTGLVN